MFMKEYNELAIGDLVGHKDLGIYMVVERDVSGIITLVNHKEYLTNRQSLTICDYWKVTETFYSANFQYIAE